VALVCLVLLLGSSWWNPTAWAASDDFEKAIEAARAANYGQAVELWSKVVQRNPRSYAALVNRGRALLADGYVYRAVMDWHEARKWSPVFAYGVYSGDYLAQASGDTAMLNYASPLELDPDYIVSVLMAGTMYDELGYRAMAVQLYRKSVELTRNPMLKGYLAHLGDLLETTPGKYRPRR